MIDEEFCKHTLVAKGFDATVRSRWMGCRVQLSLMINVTKEVALGDLDDAEIEKEEEEEVDKEEEEERERDDKKVSPTTTPKPTTPAPTPKPTTPAPASIVTSTPVNAVGEHGDNLQMTPHSNKTT